MTPRNAALLAAIVGLIAALPACAWFRGDCDTSVAVLGDSILFGAQEEGRLERRLRDEGCEVVHYDAVPGRTTVQGAEVMELWAADGTVPELVVVGLGTNDCDAGRFREAADRLVRAAGEDTRLLWIDTQRLDCDALINPEIEALARDLGDRMRVHDFRDWVLEREELILPDAIHLSPEGSRRHAERITESVVEMTSPTPL